MYAFLCKVTPLIQGFSSVQSDTHQGAKALSIAEELCNMFKFDQLAVKLTLVCSMHKSNNMPECLFHKPTMRETEDERCCSWNTSDSDS